MDRRLQERYFKLVKAHMASSRRTAAGSALLQGNVTGQAVTQAAWRFYNNDRVKLTDLVVPLRRAGQSACQSSASEFVLLAHDWCKLDYGKHRFKSDLRQLTHKHDVGYDLMTALLIDADTGTPIAPMQMHLCTGPAVYSTSESPPEPEAHHLDHLQPTMDQAERWELGRRVVHIIDREADSLGHFRSWEKAGHLFLVRGDDRRVRWNGTPWLISEIVDHFDQEILFKDAGEVSINGRDAQQEVAEATVVLYRPHKTRIDGKQRDISGPPLTVRLVMSRIVASDGEILAEWTLLTNVPASVDATTIALWYYWRWRIESFFKLLKSHGQEIEYWQQKNGHAIARRLLIAAMACVVVWDLSRQQTPEAEEERDILIRLSGRRMQYGVSHTMPALLAGYLTLLSVTDLLQNTHYDLRKLKAVANRALAIFDTS